MLPTVARDGPFRLFFFSREELRLPVHVSHPDGGAKFWIEAELALATRIGLTAVQIQQARSAVERHLPEARYRFGACVDQEPWRVSPGGAVTARSAGLAFLHGWPKPANPLYTLRTCSIVPPGSLFSERRGGR